MRVQASDLSPAAMSHPISVKGVTGFDVPMQ